MRYLLTRLLKPKYNINMKLLLIAFLFCLTASNYATSQQNSIDSTTINQIVRLINDFKACKEYSAELEQRLIRSRDLLTRCVDERDDYKHLYEQLDSMVSESNNRKEQLERKLNRTRWIGLIISCIIGIVLLI